MVGARGQKQRDGPTVFRETGEEARDGREPVGLNRSVQVCKHVSNPVVCVVFSECVCLCVYVWGAWVLGKVNSCSSRYRKPLISANENCRPY